MKVNISKPIICKLNRALIRPNWTLRKLNSLRIRRAAPKELDCFTRRTLKAGHFVWAFQYSHWTQTVHLYTVYSFSIHCILFDNHKADMVFATHLIIVLDASLKAHSKCMHVYHTHVHVHTRKQTLALHWSIAWRHKPRLQKDTSFVFACDTSI